MYVNLYLNTGNHQLSLRELRDMTDGINRTSGENNTACDRFFPVKKMDCQQQVHVPRFNFRAFKEVG